MKKKEPDFDEARERLQASLQQAWTYWMYFLAAKRKEIEASMRASGMMPDRVREAGDEVDGT